MESSFSSMSGSSKKARAPTGGSQVASCLVDGCESDLSKCRDYHRRHKVCEQHSKTPKVTIGGQEQRFCQQCSRFHFLVEFDEGKRSCRKRLEGHNRRRRKPQPDPQPVKPGNFLSSSRGSGFLAFSSSTATPLVTSKTNPGVYSSDSHLYRGRQFPFLQEPGPVLPGSSGSLNNGTGLGLNHSALSLLSSEISLSHAVVPQVSPTAHISGLHYNATAHIPTSLPSDFIPVSTAMGHFQDVVYQGGSNGSSSANNGPHQTVSFLWE